MNRKKVYMMSNASFFTNTTEDISPTLTEGDSHNAPLIVKTYREQQDHTYGDTEIGGPLKAAGGGCAGGSETLVVMKDIWTLSKNTYLTSIEGNGIRPSHRGAGIKEGNMYTLNGTEQHAVATEKVVRRLTPLECCRLQGFPDDWCDGVEGSDSAQYKMWGNGVGLPCVLYIMEGIKEAGDKYNL